MNYYLITKFYNDKGIDSSILKKLKGGLATKGKMYQRFVFPIYNQHKQIHGFSGRDMATSKDRPKWKHIGRKKSMDLSSICSPRF